MTDDHLRDEVHDELHDELERRSKSAGPGGDWARHELLPSVRRAIEARPQPVATSRGPALAGLAGVAAIILVLVVALPRVAPSPPVANPSIGTVGPGTSVPGPIRPEILTAQEFAVGVLTGRLLASTVLVDGTIGDRSARDGPRCHVSPPQGCLMGRLEGTDPSVDVQSRWRAVMQEDSSIIGGEDDPNWHWWHLPSGPITGTLLLSVGADGVIEFLGRVDSANAGEAITVAEATQVDIESLGLDDVVLVEGWLWSSGVTGEEVNISCLSPEPSPPPGLPNDFCSRTGRDAVVDYRYNVASSLTAPDPRLEVQRGAAAAYQGTVGDEPHVFALAPRLYGGACEGPPPCWKWEVVARLSRTIEPERSVIACGAGPTIVDETGLIEACAVVEPNTGSSDPIVVANPDGDKSVLQITWWGTPCDSSPTFTFKRAIDRYLLDGVLPWIDCEAMGVRHAIHVHVTQSVSADLVTASLPRPQPPTPSPTATAPSPDVSPGAGNPVDCSIPPMDPPWPPHAVIHDETGLVESCRAVDAGNVQDPMQIANPDGDLRILQVTWAGAPCDGYVDFRFGRASLEAAHRYSLDGQITWPSEVCIMPRASFEIHLVLNEDVDAGHVSVSLDRFLPLGPSPTVAPTIPPAIQLQVIDCDGGPADFSNGAVRFVDHTGTVRSCSAAAAEYRDDGVTGSNLDSNSIMLTWAVGCAADAWRTQLQLWPRQDLAPDGTPSQRYLLVVNRLPPLGDGGCLTMMTARQVVINLAAPIDWADIDVVLQHDGGGADSQATDAGEFHLSLMADAVEYSADEPIAIEASLMWAGAADAIQLSGVTSLVNGFGIRQLDGPLHMGPGWNEPCLRHELRNAELLIVPFQKSAGWRDDDPNAAFYRNWTTDPDLRLPIGTWLITAYSEFTVGSQCGVPQVSLQASIALTVQ